MKKKIISVLLCVTMTAALMGCGGAKDMPVESEAVSGEKTIVELWAHTYDPLISWLETKAESYNSEHEDVEVVITSIDSSEMSEKIYTSVAAGDGPAVFDFLDFEHGSLAAKGLIAPVDYEAMGYDSKESFAGEWYQSALAGTAGNDGEYYALPYTSNTWSLFINKELFENALLDPETEYPKTWDDVLQIAEKLTVRDENGNLVQKGFDLPFSKPSHWWCYTWGPILAQCGGNIISDDGTKAIINNEAGVEALNVLYKLVQEEKVTEAGETDEGEGFTNGTTAMWISGIWSDGSFKDTPVYENYMAVPLPQMDVNDRKTILGGYWWHVSAKVSEEVQKAAWEFLSYIVSDPSDQFANAGLLMPKAAVLESDAWNDYPYHEVFAADLEAGQWWQGSPYGTEVISIVEEAIERSLVGGEEPQESFDKAADQIDRLIKENQ